MLTSCTKDDDTTGEPPLYDITERPAAEQFTVKVSINGGDPVLVKSFDKGTSLKFNLDKINEEAATILGGYEVTNITQDGKDVKGEVELTTNATFNITALKVATVSAEMLADGKMLHAITKYERDETEEFGWKTADNKISFIQRYAPVLAEGATSDSRTWTAGISPTVLVYGDGGSISRLSSEGDVNLVHDLPLYLLKVNDQYRLINEAIYENKGYGKRLAKLDPTVKGYQTSWISEENAIALAEAQAKLAEAQAKLADAEKAIADAEKENKAEDKTKAEKAKADAENAITAATDEVATAKAAAEGAVLLDTKEVEYKDGIVTKGDVQYVYDGTYLYELAPKTAVYEVKDMPKFDIKNFNTASLAPSSSVEGVPNDISLVKVEGDRNVYVKKSGRSSVRLVGFFDVNNDGKVEYEAEQVNVEKLSQLDFGIMNENVVLFPDMTIAFGRLGYRVVTFEELEKAKIEYFIDGDYLVYYEKPESTSEPVVPEP
jgi:hypothetical protein